MVIHFSQWSNCLSKMPNISLDSLATLLSLIILQALFWHCCPTLFLWHGLYKFFILFDVRFLMFAALFDLFYLLLKKRNISDVIQNGVCQQWVLLISIKYIWNFSGNEEWKKKKSPGISEMIFWIQYWKNCARKKYIPHNMIFCSIVTSCVLSTTKICVAKAVF